MPPVPPGVGSWSSSRRSAEGERYSGSDCRATAGQHAPPTLPRAVRGINAHRRFIFLPPAVLSQHGSAPRSTSTVTLRPSPRLPQPGVSCHVPTGSLQLSPPRRAKPPVPGHSPGQEQPETSSGCGARPGPPSSVTGGRAAAARGRNLLAVGRARPGSRSEPRQGLPGPVGICQPRERGGMRGSVARSRENLGSASRPLCPASAAGSQHWAGPG